MTYDVADHRRPRRPVVHHPAHPGGTDRAPRDDAELGAHDLRHDGPFARLHERDASRPGPPRPTTSRSGRPEFADNMRRYYEYIRENDLVLTHSLINLQRSRNVSGMFNLRKAPRCRWSARPTPRHRRARRARAGHAGADRRRDRGLFAAPRPAHRATTARSRSPSPSPAARRACASSAATASISAARISIIRSARASRRWTASCSSTMSLVPWERVFIYGDVDLLNGAASATHYFGAFVAPGCRQEPGQVRVRAGRRAADDRDAGQHAPAARRGAHRRADADHAR